MEIFVHKGDDMTPDILLDHENDQFIIKGESRPENARKFFEPISTWFQAAFKHYNAHGITSPKKLTINLDYFNSTSAKLLFDMLMMISSEGKEKGIAFEIEWHHHQLDDDMLESGQELEKCSGLKFHYISKN